MNSVEGHIIKLIARKHKMTVEEVTKIIKIQSEYLKHVVENSGFDGVAFPYLGKFILKPYSLIRFNNLQFIKQNELIYGRKLPGSHQSGDEADSSVSQGDQS